MAGQMRVASGSGGFGYIGFDMVAALEMGGAMGLSRRIVADLLPRIEAVAIPKMNEQLR